MATRRDWYKAAALALRDRIVHRWLTAEKESYDAGRKRVYYLSLEFLIGRLFTDALNNMGLLPVFEAALGDLGVGLSDLRKCEPDAALGNGGLGRLAACFMESMATLAIPAIGYGIRYDFGLFRQIIVAGLAAGISRRMARLRQPLGIPAAGGGLPRAFRRRRRACRRPAAATAPSGIRRKPCRRWPTTPRSSAGAASTSTRCGCGRRARPIRCKLDVFNTGDYLGASAEEARAEAICKFLYPNDESAGGPRIAAAPGIFLRLGLAAGSGQAPSRLRRPVAQPRAEGRGAAQRHPSEPRRHRTDADPGRPAQFPLGRGVEDHGRRRCPTPTTRCCRKRSRPGRSNCSSGCCRGISKSSTASTSQHLALADAALPRRRRFPRLGLADRREVRPPGADGAAGLRRLAPHQRRLGDAFRPDEGDRVPRSQSSLSRRASPTRPTASPSAAG